MENETKPVATISVSHRDMYDSVCDMNYDMLCEGSTDVCEGAFAAFVSADSMRMALRDGWTYTLLAKHMHLIEGYHGENKPFIVTIWKGAELWAVINGTDCNY